MNTRDEKHAGDASSLIAHKRPLVWVIDDSPTLRNMVALTLKREGGEVIEYAAPLQMLSDVIVEHHPLPDVALVDLHLPRMNGYQLIQFLRSRQHASEMAIILMMRLDGVLPKLKARLAGANTSLLKPFTAQELLTLVIEHSPH